MKKTFLTILACLMAILTLTLTACSEGKGETVLEFTCKNSEFSDEKSIYINKEFDSLVLSADFEIQDATATMQILDKQNNQVVWEKTTSNTEKFDIELKNIDANTEYFFCIEVGQTKYMHLLITSPVKLVKDKEKPEVK